MYITSDELTNDYFERFKTVKIFNPKFDKEKTWQVVGVDPYYGDGILQVFLDEFFENTIADKAEKEKQSAINKDNLVNKTIPYIKGPTSVSQYSKAYYEICNANKGRWFLKWKDQEQNLNSSLKIIPLNISIGELGKFTLIYRR